MLNRYYAEGFGGDPRPRGGAIDKFIGDGLMATFGGLVAVGQPRRAAALRGRPGDARTACAPLNASVAARGSRPVRQSASACTSARWCWAPSAARERKDFTVIGDAVNTASRVESLTKEYGHPDPHHPRAARPAARGAGGPVCQPLGTAQVKGRQARRWSCTA